MMSASERNWGMFCHLIAFAGFLVPFGSIVGPLVIWLIKKDEYPFVDDQGKESVNFQISILIYAIVAGLSIFVAIGVVLLPAVIIFNIVMIVIATVRSNGGDHYRYPLCIRFVS